MSEVIGPDVTIELPPGLMIEGTGRRGPAGRIRGPIPRPAAIASSSMDAALVEGLQRQAFELVDTINVVPDSKVLRRGGPPAKIRAAVAADEDAVLLVEEEGVFRWTPPKDRSEMPLAGATRRGGDGLSRDQVVEFEIPLIGAADDRDQTRGFVEKVIVSRLRAYVFRFVVRKSIGGVVGALERHVDAGLFFLNGPDLEKWSPSARTPRPPSRSLKQGKVLLLVHGTFSSVVGTFGELVPTPWGSDFLQRCLAEYDVVLGFNHRTLSEDPKTNAAALLAALLELDLGRAPVFDVITHSRGGLVVRTLIEELTPGSALKGSFGKVILVATTNNGTHLADSKNWRDLADLYTTLAVAACRALQALPGATLAATILKEAITSLGELVRQISSAGLDAKLVPGLAAMRPDEDFVNALNQTQFGQFGAQDSIYRVISSSFKPTLIGGPSELPARLMKMLADGFMDQLMEGERHDLVVDTKSMSAIDLAAGDFVRDRLDFEDTPFIYHTNYFSRPEVVAALVDWLELPELGRGRGGSRRATSAPTAMETAPYVATGIVKIDAMQTVSDVLAEIGRARPEFVVVERKLPQGDVGHYVYRPLDFARRGLRGSQGNLVDALNLHETDRDPQTSLSAVSGRGGVTTFQYAKGRVADGSRLRRTVIFDKDGSLIGVAPNEAEVVIPKSLQDLLSARGRIDLAARLRSIDTSDMLAELRGLSGAEPDVLQSRLPSRARSATARSRSRHGPGIGAEEDRPPIVAPSTDCSILVEAPEKVRLDHVATVQLTVSREAVAAAVGSASVGDKVGIKLDRAIVVDLICKRGFAPVDSDAPERFDPPTPNSPVRRYFEINATDLGEGEIWMVVRQGRTPLTTLSLKIEVVAADAIVPSGAQIEARAKVEEARGPAPKNCLRIYEMRQGPDIVFRYELDCPSLGLLEKGFSGPVTQDREKFTTDLYTDIESRWTGSGKQAAAFVDELKTAGAQLWARLLPEKLRLLLWTHRGALDGIYILSEEPFIPWELLYMVEPGKPKAADSPFLAELGMVRWLWEAGAQPPAHLTVRPGRAQYVIPEYPDIPDYLRSLPQAQAEKGFLEDRFGAVAADPTPDGIKTLLSTKGSFDLFHFAGHGAAAVAGNLTDDANIMLQGEDDDCGNYMPNYLKADFVETSADFGKGRPIIVLNACQAGRANWKLTGMGGFAQACLSRGAGVFVGTLWSVGDHPAREFTEALYSTLLDGKSLAEAAVKARAAAKSAGDPTWLAYAVYGHPDAHLAMTKVNLR